MKLNILFPIVILISLGCTNDSQEGSAPSAINLTTCDLDNPVGVSASPYFGWYMQDPDDDELQSAYQIVVARSISELKSESNLVWNSGKVESSLQNHIQYGGKKLKSGTRYFWKVKIWDKSGQEGTYSDASHFDFGLLSNDDWTGSKWIKRNNDDNEDYTYFRKRIELDDQDVKRAIVYVSAVHDFELYIDGQIIGKGPGYHYPQYQYYQAYDISDLLKSEDDHQLASLVHWYGGGQGRPKSSRGFILKLEVEYANGSIQAIGTDNTWKQKQATHFIVNQPYRNGEGVGFVDKIDSREYDENWNLSNYNDSSWDAAVEIGSHPVDPFTGVMQSNLTRLKESKIEPKSVMELEEGHYVVDLGKVYAGVPEIQFVGGNSGEQVDVLAGYTLNSDGSVSTESDQNTDMRYSFILNGTQATFKPMVYLGMRYLEIENSPNKLSSENVKFIVRRYELDETRSSFSSSNEMLNQVWSLMKHSILMGTQESFVDTPTREKGGFLGDSWSIGATAMSTTGDRTMNLRILNEFLDSQDQYWPDGRMNAVYPNVDGGRDIPDYTQMFPFWAWDYYMFSGDRKFLSDNFNRIEKVAQYVANHISEQTGLVENLTGGGGPYLYGIVDWPAQMRYGYDMNVSARTIQNAYAYRDFEIMSLIAAELDNDKLKKHYRELADALKAKINAQLINDEGLYVDGLRSDQSTSDHASQHANMLPLALGIVPEENRNHVIDFVIEKNMSVGMVTLRWLPEAIGQAEEGEHLMDLYTNPEWDGWAKIVALGGTFTWETWDAITSGESLSHPWGAVGALGIQKYILGVSILKPQHELIQIKPLDFGENLDHAQGIIPTDRGDVSVSWQKTKDKYSLEITIPDNMSAQIYLPSFGAETTSVTIDGSEKQGTLNEGFLSLGMMGSGRHTIVYELGK